MDPSKCGATDEEEAQFVAMQFAQMELEPQNLPQPIITLDQVIQSTNLIHVLKSQEGFIEHLMAKARRDDNDDEFKGPVTMGHDSSLQVPLPSFDDLRPQDRVRISDLASAPNQVLWGNYLLCQTISSAISDVGLEVAVTDPEGVGGMRIVLYNYSSVEKSVLEVNFDEILPPGSFLVLKNPWFSMTPNGWLVLICDNPEEVELISKKRVEVKFPDLEWIGAIATNEIHNSQKRHFWKDLKDDQTAFAKLKRLGNKGFVDKRFSDAIRFYNMALDYCTNNRETKAIINSNKSAALLALGCFNVALKCAEAALEFDPGNEKCYYRKTKALIGLGKYEEALNFLQKKFDQVSSLNKNKDCKKLMEDVKFLYTRKNLGPTELQLLSLNSQILEDDDKIPEFTAPVFTISEIEGKGRGFFATEDIHPGQLLIFNRAFVYHKQSLTTHSSPETLAEQMKRKIANKLIFDPALGPELYNLTAGAELGHLEAGDWRTRHVDMKRILGVVDVNMFGNDTGEDSAEMGLWIAPSFFNHSCSEHNCMWDICGEWLMVKAIAQIKKGDELTLAYKSPIISYEERHNYFNKQGFSCNCKLCQLEATEPASVRKERQEILQSLGELTIDCGSKEIKKALEAVDRLVSLRKDNVALNFPLLSHEAGRLGGILFEKGLVAEEISLASRKFDVTAVSACWHEEGIILAIELISCHVTRGDKDSAKMWMTRVKRLMMKFYGNLEVMRFKGRAAIQGLKERFGIDFFNGD